MQGYYQVNAGYNDVVAPALNSHVVFGAGADHWQIGGKWRIQANVQQYELVKMNAPAVGGLVGAARGARTTGLAGCITIAAIQYDHQERPERYYFSHIDASSWKNAEWKEAFRNFITEGARTYVVIVNLATAGADILVDAVRLWPLWPIPRDGITVYGYEGVGQAFAMDVRTGAVGQYPD
jgi:hypothetical protein